jgi:membrane-bound acyltransferase YfiQ involved in biofilm formation
MQSRTDFFLTRRTKYSKADLFFIAGGSSLSNQKKTVAFSLFLLSLLLVNVTLSLSFALGNKSTLLTSSLR